LLSSNTIALFLKKAGIGHGISSDFAFELNPKVAEKIKHFQFQLYGKTINRILLLIHQIFNPTAKNINTLRYSNRRYIDLETAKN
jgi:hypothetical protein